MADLNPTHLVTKKNIYVVISIVLFAIILLVVYKLYKSYLAGEIANKLIQAVDQTSKVDSETLKDPLNRAEVYVRLKQKYKDYPIKQLLRLNQFTVAEIVEIVKQENA